IVGGVEGPGQVDHAVDVAEQVGEVVLQDVALAPVDLVAETGGFSPGDGDDRVHLRIVLEGSDDAAPEVPGRSHHCHPGAVRSLHWRSPRRLPSQSRTGLPWRGNN